MEYLYFYLFIIIAYFSWHVFWWMYRGSKQDVKANTSIFQLNSKRIEADKLKAQQEFLNQFNRRVS